MLPLLPMLLSAVLSPSTTTRLPSAINDVWGDASWFARYGRAPTVDDSPEARVRVHLEEVLVRLREVPTGDLEPATRARREVALRALERYTAAGLYPRNVDSVASRPEFIDHDGRLCAVGAMIAATAGRGAAEMIDARFNRDSVWAMDMPEVAAWATEYGFNTTELALIQPSYSPQWFHPRTHRNNAVGVRAGAAVWGESTYEASREGLTHTDDAAADLAVWWLWQPGSHWGLGGALNVRSNLFDYYEGDRPGISLLVKGEYAEAIAERGLFDIALMVEAGPVFVAGSPGDFAGFEFGGGLSLLSTFDLWQMISFRLDVRAQHYLLYGAQSQSIGGTQLLATFGAEWRFSL